MSKKKCRDVKKGNQFNKNEQFAVSITGHKSMKLKRLQVKLGKWQLLWSQSKQSKNRQKQ